jgi:hypothetical protein
MTEGKFPQESWRVPCDLVLNSLSPEAGPWESSVNGKVAKKKENTTPPFPELSAQPLTAG